MRIRCKEIVNRLLQEPRKQNSWSEIKYFNKSEKCACRVYAISSRFSAQSSQIHLDRRTAELCFLDNFNLTLDRSSKTISKPVLNHRFVSMVVHNSNNTKYVIVFISHLELHQVLTYGVQARRLPLCLGELSSKITTDRPMMDCGPDKGRFTSVKSRCVVLTSLANPATTKRPCFMVRSPTMQRRWVSVLQSLAFFSFIYKDETHF